MDTNSNLMMRPAVLIRALKFISCIADMIGLPEGLYTGENISKYAIASEFLPKTSFLSSKFRNTLKFHTPCQIQLIDMLYKNPVHIQPAEWKTFLELFTTMSFNNEDDADINSKLDKNEQILYYHTLTNDKNNKESLSTVLSKLFTFYINPRPSPSSSSVESSIETKGLKWTDYWNKAIGPLDRDVGEIDKKLKEKYPTMNEELILNILEKLDSSNRTLVTDY